MLKNPILYDYYVRRNHILLSTITGFAYALTFGYSSKMPAYALLTDAILCSFLFYIGAVVIWSVYTFSHFESLNASIHLAVNIGYCCISLISFSGFELLAANIVYPEYIGAFISQLVPRIFCLIIIYIAFRWYYLSNQPENIEESLPDDSNNSYTEPDDHKQIERITIKVGQKIKVIAIEDIVFLKAEDDYVSIHTEGGHWLKSETMKKYEACLPQDQFARVHRSYIVNISKISKIERYGQKQLLQLSDGTSIRVSATGYKLLREKLNL